MGWARRVRHDTLPVRPAQVRVAIVAAIVTGLIGFLLAIATPLLPVSQTTAEIDWPQGGRVSSVQAPLVSYVPTDLTVSIPCTVLTDPAVARGGQVVLFSTTAKSTSKAVERGLFVRTVSGDFGRFVEVVVRNKPVVSASFTQIRNQGCTSISVTATSSSVTASFEGMRGSDGSRLQGSTDGGDQRPQLTGMYTDLVGPASQFVGLNANATIDTRYDTPPTLLKTALVWIGIASTIIALVALAVLDSTDGRRRRRIVPTRWWRLNARDGVVIAALAVWHVIGPNTSDDGYLLTMSRVAEHAGYTANYYRWYAAPEAPFGWYYRAFGWLAEVTTASPWVRLPALLCGVAAWLLLSHGLLPRLGRTARTRPIVSWTAAFVFLASWFPFDNGLRPEPVICLGAVLTWCLIERAIATGRILPAAVACIVAAFSLAAGPTGLMAVAALLAAGRPIVSATIKLLGSSVAGSLDTPPSLPLFWPQAPAFCSPFSTIRHWRRSSTPCR